MGVYGEKHSSKTVRKNVTLPQWVNTLGEKHNANFSKVLQEAIVEKYAQMGVGRVRLEGTQRPPSPSAKNAEVLMWKKNKKYAIMKPYEYNNH